MKPKKKKVKSASIGQVPCVRRYVDAVATNRTPLWCDATTDAQTRGPCSTTKILEVHQGAKVIRWNDRLHLWSSNMNSEPYTTVEIVEEGDHLALLRARGV